MMIVIFVSFLFEADVASLPHLFRPAKVRINERNTKFYFEFSQRRRERSVGSDGCRFIGTKECCLQPKSN